MIDWPTIGIASTRAADAIKRAYSVQLRKHRPDRDPRASSACVLLETFVVVHRSR